MITLIVRRVAPLVGLAVLLVGFMRPQQVPPARSDMWFHLRFGHELLGGWSLGSPGNLGPFDSAAWIPTQWLPQVAMAWLEDHAGLDSVIWAVGVVILVLIVLLYVSCRDLAAPLPSAMAVVVGTLAASPGLSARPQVLSYLFVVVTVAAWLRTSQDGRPRYWLVALAWLWPMCHGMWPVGISISLAAAAGLVLERSPTRGGAARLLAIPLASAAVALLTPTWSGTYRSLLAVGSRSDYFEEWGAPDFTAPTTALLAVMILVVVVSGLRAGPVSWMHVALTVLAIAWSLYSLRTTVVGALILTPLLAAALARVVPVERPPTRRERVLLVVITLSACCLLGPVVKAQPDKQIVPTWVDDRLDSLPSGARVLNDWDTGSWLLYRHPQVDVVMHGYADVFTDAEIERNFDLTRLRAGWDAELSELDVDVAVLDPNSPLGYALENVLGWDVEQADDEFVFLVPPADLTRPQAEVAATHRSSAARAAPESIASAAFVTPAASAASTSESGES